MLSTYLINTFLRSVFVEREVYLSLHEGDPGNSGKFEVNGTQYRRQRITFTEPMGRVCTNDSTVEFSDMPRTVVSHAGLWDAPVGGNFLAGQSWPTPRETEAGDAFRVRQGRVRVSLQEGEQE